MKTKTTAIFIVFLVGGICGALVHSVTTSPTGTPALSPAPTVPPPSRDNNAGSHEESESTRIIQEITPFSWGRLESTDFKVYIANLRAIGCPERTIRDLIRSDLDHIYRTRHEALEKEMPRDQNFWEPRRESGPVAHYARETSRRQLEREKDALLNELLGSPGGPPTEDRTDVALNVEGTDPSQWGHETQERIHEIQEKYHLLEDQIHHDARGEIYPEDATAIADLRKQRQEELSNVLTPEQLHEFELRESATAEHMRNDLVAFQSTEEEFRAIFDVRQAMESELGLTEFHFDSPEYQQQREAAESEMNDQIRALLSEERFADYELATDHHFRDLYRLGERFDLPQDNIRNMYDLWQTSEHQAHQIRSNDVLNEPERNRALDLLQQQVEANGLAYLGEAGFYNYRSRGGEWVHHLFEDH